MTAGQKNAAVLDLTHGGIIIAQKMAQLGYNVSAIDVYNTVDPETLADLQDFNIHTSKDPIPVNEFDIIIAPVHLDPNYKMLQQARDMGKEIVTHHKIVGEILSHDKTIVSTGARIIEITGTKAKTSTSSILADMLSCKMNVVLHTTRGLEYWENGTPSLIYKGLSIAPGSILHAVDKTASYISSNSNYNYKSNSKSNLVPPDVYIFEVSIGGTGYADIGILTTLTQDYKIANNTAWASNAKMQMLDNAKSGSTLIINCTDDAATCRNLNNSVKTVTFSDSKDYTGDVTLTLDEDTIIMNSGSNWMSVINAQPGYDVGSYTTAMVAAATAALEMGVELDIIRDTLADFEGLSGRMREQVFEGKTLVDNSNSGMNIISVTKSLAYASTLQIKKKGRIIMVLGEEAAQVCEGLSPDDVSGFLQQQGKNIDELVLVGERMHAVKHKNAHYADSLSQGLSIASGIAGDTDLILSCVKCFR